MMVPSSESIHDGGGLGALHVVGSAGRRQLVALPGLLPLDLVMERAFGLILEGLFTPLLGDRLAVKRDAPFVFLVAARDLGLTNGPLGSMLAPPVFEQLHVRACEAPPRREQLILGGLLARFGGRLVCLSGLHFAKCPHPGAPGAALTQLCETA
jgi:hypothetical protein